MAAASGTGRPSSSDFGCDGARAKMRGVVHNVGMRLAFVDLLFTWPPHGGAVVDVYHTMLGLQSAGHNVHLFALGEDGTLERGWFNSDDLPFPATRIQQPQGDFNPSHVAARIGEEVLQWKPDIVFLCDGLFLKPYIADVLRGWPLVSRFYAYEMSCLRDHMQFKNNAPCPYDYFRDPNVCRRCAVNHHRGSIMRGQMPVWAREFLTCGAYRTRYYDYALETMRRYRAIIVYNERQRELLRGIHANVHLVPGGVDTTRFPFVPMPDERRGKQIIFMPGRAEDPVKGAGVLREAGALLATSRNDFEIRITHADTSLDTDWFKAIGWRGHHALHALYTEADICVVPSVWEEPFGMVALEAMSAGRPVVASRVGGLQHIVRENQTGLLCAPGNARELAERMGSLLDDPERRREMGRQARALVETSYTWPKVIEQHYPQILDNVLP